MKAVILDFDTLKPDELDTSALKSLPLDWTIYPATSEQQTMGRVKDAQVLLTNKVRLDSEHLASAKHLRYVGVMATGTNNIDMHAAAMHGIRVNNVTAYGTASVVQHTLMLMMALAGSFNAYQNDIRNGGWQAADMFCLMQHPMRELAGKHLVIVGYGELGKALAQAADALGMQVSVAASLSGESQDDRLPLDVLLPQADVVSLHCLLSDKTENLFDAKRFAIMKPGSLFINTARGGLVDELALLDALRNGHLGGAGLDVLSQEPPPFDHPLLTTPLPNLIVTPHNAWATREARQRLLDQVVAKLNDYLSSLKLN